ncbi:type I-B CRISPR-associated protein Cas7/Csh2 [Clostridium aestuarii]|uniref:Type I-B CRISPR-associated protein Cas7/Csh2 n=1 Tax=Clostridium aestuarii TaxID=338193 RepID=A0ABT4D5L0_9CLOT|nr:type I-B CRISPR-associated protein Cas7/Csh2 [Clostridium aestuarii]MCY6485480.1 type I-B CRISPR-associated protein Cas7/Csh2 [Clostridium aestuarii]
MNRSELIFLYDIKDNNPNGDPLDSNKPRIDEETGINFVTDVRLKRTIRDYFHEYCGKEIFVREIRNDKGNVQDAKSRAKDFGENKEEVIEKVLNDCIDVRLFGATIPLEFSKKDKSSATFTGPVQFNVGRSLHKVALKRIKGTGAFASGEGKDNKTFREEYILPYSLIGFQGIINEHAAEKTNLKDEDIALLLEGIWNGTKNLISRSKVGQMPRVLIKVNYKEDSFHIGDLIKGIKLETELNDEEDIRDLEGFKLNINKLVSTLTKNKEKILSIEYIIDDNVNFVLEGKEIKINEAVKKLNPVELKIKG